MLALAAVYRPNERTDWEDCEITAVRNDGYVLRQVGRPLAGVWLAQRHQVRIAGRVLELREFSTEAAKATSEAMKRVWEAHRLPAMTTKQLGQYKILRTVADRDEALRLVLEP